MQILISPVLRPALRGAFGIALVSEGRHTAQSVRCPLHLISPLIVNIGLDHDSNSAIGRNRMWTLFLTPCCAGLGGVWPHSVTDHDIFVGQMCDTGSWAWCSQYYFPESLEESYCVSSKIWSGSGKYGKTPRQRILNCE
jgi:hypothetical protein